MAKLRRERPAVRGPDVLADPTSAARKDPRWMLMPHARRTPATTYVLMVGQPADGRLRGWVSSEQPASPTPRPYGTHMGMT